LFERYQGGEQAILVHVDFKDEAAREDLRELEMLATSAGATILGTVTTRRDSPQAKFLSVPVKQMKSPKRFAV
jgi:GTP-binding protein HflX (EC 3.1.5.-)